MNLGTLNCWSSSSSCFSSSAARLPKLARSLGQAQKEFKEGLSEESDDEDNA